MKFAPSHQIPGLLEKLGLSAETTRQGAYHTDSHARELRVHARKLNLALRSATMGWQENSAMPNSRWITPCIDLPDLKTNDPVVRGHCDPCLCLIESKYLPCEKKRRNWGGGGVELEDVGLGGSSPVPSDAF